MSTFTHPFKKHEKELIKQFFANNNPVIVYPTETFYALGCAADNSEAVQKIYEIKKRKSGFPLLVLIDSWQMLDQYADNLDSSKMSLLKKHWPGPLTAILQTKDSKLAKELNYQYSTLGFRMTSSPIARELIRMAGVPLVGTSANRSSEPEAATCDAAKQYFTNQVDIYIDGGRSPGILPSTLIDLTGKDYKVIREGMIKV
ncbi:threonylcarbamoyl-AMP synthase [bacterium]|nr:threonylcarbamoyl-AMP synthase [bacterium]